MNLQDHIKKLGTIDAKISVRGVSQDPIAVFHNHESIALALCPEGYEADATWDLSLDSLSSHVVCPNCSWEDMLVSVNHASRLASVLYAQWDAYCSWDRSDWASAVAAYDGVMNTSSQHTSIFCDELKILLKTTLKSAYAQHGTSLALKAFRDQQKTWVQSGLPVAVEAAMLEQALLNALNDKPDVLVKLIGRVTLRGLDRLVLLLSHVGGDVYRVPGSVYHNIYAESLINSHRF